MHGVNNSLVTMSGSVGDVGDVGLERLKSLIISMERKKRNLEKRRSKLEEYTRKTDLNEDQQIAVIKYPEVMSNLELLEELSVLANQQLRDAEKSLKKLKKQERIEKKRYESQLVEFVLQNYCVIERVGSNDRIRRRLIIEDIINEQEVDKIVNLFNELRISEKGDWKKCSENLLYFFEPAIMTSEESKLACDKLISTLNKVAEMEWLWLDEIEEYVSKIIDIEEKSEEYIDSSLHLKGELSATAEPLSEPVISIQNLSIDSSKLNFVFLHDSMVNQDSLKIPFENGYTQFANESELLPKSECKKSEIWQTMDSNIVENVEDVFSHATQSEFLHHENNKNAWTKGNRTIITDRFKNYTNVHPSSNVKEGQGSDINYWKSERGNSNSGFSRSARSRGYGRGKGRPENRIRDALSAQ